MPDTAQQGIIGSVPYGVIYLFVVVIGLKAFAFCSFVDNFFL